MLRAPVLQRLLRLGLLLLACTLPAEAAHGIERVTVDFSTPVPGTAPAHGFLHSVSLSAPGDARIQPLRPAFWRVGNSPAFSVPGDSRWPAIHGRLVSLGAKVQLVVSDSWGYGSRPPPFQDWPAWESWVRSIARENRSRALQYDVWNEPDLARFWPGTRDQFFETYLRAYRVLRQELGPSALIGGPSLSRWDLGYLTAFVDFCRQNGCEINFLSWHELDDRSSALDGIPSHLQAARTAFIQDAGNASVRVRELHVNETIGSQATHDPAAAIAYLAQLEKGGAHAAAKACWKDSTGASECYDDSLDGLLVSGTSEPRAIWWAYAAHAAGLGSRVASTSTSPRLFSLASAGSDAPEAAQVVLAYFSRGVTAPPSLPVEVELRALSRLSFASGLQRLHLRLESIPNDGENALDRPRVVAERDLDIAADSTTFSIPSIAMGEVLRAVLSRSGGVPLGSPGKPTPKP
jgi:hypothetical protein